MLLITSVIYSTTVRFSVLSSGSKANCTVIEAGTYRFLVDCGLSCKQVELRLNSVGINPETISAVIISHEHSDHIYGLARFAKRYQTPIYTNLAPKKLNLSKSAGFAFEQFATGTSFSIGPVTIHSFPVLHDACDPVGFRCEYQGLVLAIATDLGQLTTLVENGTRAANAIILEANHDLSMLMNGSYPWPLKQRIASSHGHLSNENAAELISKITHGELAALVLAHLSQENNTPALAKNAIETALGANDDLFKPSQLLVAGITSALPMIEIERSLEHQFISRAINL